LRWIPPVVATYTLIALAFTILVHYVSAPTDVINHVPALSETGAYLPGKYIFAAALTVPAVSLFFGSIAVFLTTKQHLDQITQGSRISLQCLRGCCRITWVNVASLMNGVIASVTLFGLGVVPIQELTPDDTQLMPLGTFLHLSFTGIFFVSILTHMILSTIVAAVYDRTLRKNAQLADLGSIPKRMAPWVIFKIVMISLTLIFWPIIPLISGLITVISCSAESLENDSCGFYKFLRTVGALNQWALVICIIAFLVSYMHELRNAKITFDDTNEYDEQLAALRLGEHVFNEAETDNRLVLNDDEFELHNMD
jgi:hypothetical protein